MHNKNTKAFESGTFSEAFAMSGRPDTPTACSSLSGGRGKVFIRRAVCFFVDILRTICYHFPRMFVHGLPKNKGV